MKNLPFFSSRRTTNLYRLPLFNTFNGPVPTSIHWGSLFSVDSDTDGALLLDNAFDSIDDDSDSFDTEFVCTSSGTDNGNDSLYSLTRNKSSHTSSSSPVFISTFSGN